MRGTKYNSKFIWISSLYNNFNWEVWEVWDVNRTNLKFVFILFCLLPSYLVIRLICCTLVFTLFFFISNLLTFLFFAYFISMFSFSLFCERLSGWFDTGLSSRSSSLSSSVILTALGRYPSRLIPISSNQVKKINNRKFLLAVDIAWQSLFSDLFIL